MEKEQYELLFKLEDEYWWHIGLRKLIINTILSNSNGKNALRILDAGCGTGGNLVALNRLGYTVGVDLSEEALYFSKQRNINKLVEGSISDLPFEDNCFDVLLSVDVLYHQQVKDDVIALQELFRVLKKEGLLILHLPAFEFLKGGHDDLVHTKKRYKRCEVEEKLKSVGFKLIKITYRNFIFFFVAIILRRLINKNETTEFKKLPPWLNRIFIYLTYIDNFVLKVFNLYLGTSVYCIAKKP